MWEESDMKRSEIYSLRIFGGRMQWLTNQKTSILENVLHYRSKVWNSYDFFNVSERSLLRSQRLHLFNQKYKKNCELLQSEITVFFVNIL